MKKALLPLFFLLSVNTISFKANSQVYEKGCFGVDVFMGVLNTLSNTIDFFKQDDSDNAEAEIIGLGPIGVKTEYYITDQIGLGFIAAFEKETTYYSEESQILPGTYYNYVFKEIKLKIIPRFNFHITGKDWNDLYLFTGLGYQNRSFSIETNNPAYEPDESSAISPATISLGAGFKFYFNDMLGVFVELDIGSSLSTAGVCVLLY